VPCQAAVPQPFQPDLQNNPPHFGYSTGPLQKKDRLYDLEEEEEEEEVDLAPRQP